MQTYRKLLEDEYGFTVKDYGKLVNIKYFLCRVDDFNLLGLRTD